MGEPTAVRVAAGQLRGCGGTVDERLEDIAGVATRASSAGVSLLVLPEMSVPGYDLSRDSFAEAIPGPTTTALTAIARDADLLLVAGLTELVREDRFNALALVGPDGWVGTYRKHHVSAVENAFWRTGPRGGAVIDCDLGRIGFGICADMIFPSPWNAYVGAVDLVVIGAAWPDHHHTSPFPYGSDFCTTHVEATRDVPQYIAARIGVPVVLANAAGEFEARLPPFGSRLRGRFAGRSCIVSDDGSIVRAGTEAELITAEVELGRPAASGNPEPWLPQWSHAFRVAARGGDTALGLIYRAFYRR